ncbi:hypothetical protein BLNAU_15490 [Blattamonas nauphoetae]|uniref:Uncharacterized protein n=1 Tax=Blattamonas nauphoetae TaxID=2049346 RepID=A0ABQ9XHG2_9EUKA|nr:hypothetical protein BLNAU_15490 [Blattamonas nauphoetae]
MKTQTAKRERNPRDHRLQKGSLTNKETTDRQTNSSDPSSLDNVEASQPGNPEDDQKAPATPPVQTGKPNSQDWRNKLEKQKQQRREIVIVRQEQDNARSPFECRFCDWFCSTAYKTMRHEKVCKLNPQSEKFKRNEQPRRKHEENERKVAQKAQKTTNEPQTYHGR